MHTPWRLAGLLSLLLLLPQPSRSQGVSFTDMIRAAPLATLPPTSDDRVPYVHDDPVNGWSTQALLATALLAALPSAGSSTTLAAFTSATPGVLRCGVNAIGDAPCMLFTLNSTPCAHPDLFSQVTLTTGGCATAVWPGYVDPRQFGAAIDGSTVDTAAWNAIDTFEGTLAKTIPVQWGGVSVTCAITFSHITVINGGGAGILKSCPAFVADSAILNYVGNGPLTITGVTCLQPVYVSSVEPLNSGYCFSNVPTSGMAEHIVIDNLYSVGGGDAAVDIHSASDVLIRNLTADRPYLWGLHIATAQVTSKIKVQQIVVEDLHCIASGSECAVFPNNQGNVASAATRAIRLTAKADGCNLWQSGHTCFAIAGSTSDQFDIRVSGSNASAGLLSVKRNTDYVTSTPSIVANSYYQAVYSTSVDNGAGLIFSHDSGVVGTGFFNQMADVKVAWNQAPPWQGNTVYRAGDFVTNPCAAASGLCLYGAIGNGATSAQGTSAGSGGPASQVAGAQIIDGTVNWLYQQALAQVAVGVQTPNIIGGVSFQGSMNDLIVNVDVEKTRGCVDIASNNPNDILRRVTITCRGTIHGPALTDNSSSGSMTVDYLTLAKWNIHSLGGDTGETALVYIGGGQGGAAITYTHLAIDGGEWNDDGASHQCIRASSSAAALGNAGNPFYIHGAPFFRCGKQFLLTAAPIYLDWSGGGEIVVHDHNGTPFQADGAAVTALNSTLNINGTVNIVTDAAVGTGDYQGWSDTNAAVANWNVDRLLRGYATTIPVNTACNFGDTVANQTPSATVPHDWRCKTPDTTNGAWQPG